MTQLMVANILIAHDGTTIVAVAQGATGDGLVCR